MHKANNIRNYITIALLFMMVQCWAQPYGNGWIAFNTAQPYSVQPYWKIKVWQDGLYRIKVADLALGQFPVLGTDPRNIQLFFAGAEQCIYINGEMDGTLDPSDYIEFYGKKNTGWFDSLLYQLPTDQGHDAVSFFSDTATYYLTIKTGSTNNRRMLFEAPSNINAYTPEPFFTRKVSYTPSFSYMRGFQDFYGLSLSAYTKGEGFAGPVFTNTSNPNFATLLNTPNAVTGNTPMRIKMRIKGANLRDHFLNVTLNNTPVFNTAFVQYDVVDTNIVLPNIPLSNTVNAEFTALPNPDNSVGSMAVNYIELFYNHSFNFATETAPQYQITARGNLAAPYTRWDITNLNFQQPILLLYANDTLKRIALNGSGNNFQALLPTYGFDKTCILLDSASQTFTNDAAIRFEIKPVRAGNPLAPPARFSNFAYNPNAQLLVITHSHLWAAAETYKSYRENNPYNIHTTLMADVNELYDQFAYGINKHPLAIKNFIRYTYDNFTIKPKHVFLIGKSIKNFLRITNQGIPGFDDDNLVPTFGEPPSDLMFTTGLLPNDSVTRPVIPVGRLSAATPQDVTDYLEKVIDYEAQPNHVWMKNVLHFAGGVSIQQRQDIESKLAEYATIISDSAFGGFVRTISKTVTDPIQIELSNKLQQIIDSGVSLMTFYAHAGASTFDISTDEPASWHNNKRYPLVLGNSCYVGDAHQKGRAAAENFVLQKNKGAIGFIGSASVNYIENLYPYAKSFYQHLSLYNYGNSIGRCLVKGIDTTWVNYNAGFYTETVTIGMNLQGDPTLKLNAAEKPDFEITTADVSFNPTTVSAIADSFDVNIVIKNIGLATLSPYVVEVKRAFGNGNVTDSLYVRPALAYTDTLKLRFAVDAVQGPGLNAFTVKVDPFNTVAELNDSTNNEVQQQLFILSNDITPIYPPPFAIIGTNNFQLQASTVNQFAPATRYVFELDTTDMFSSPMLWHDTITASGGYITKNLPFTPISNTVYYWRVSRDSVAGDPIHPAWNEASFIYIPNQNGWSQAHFYQFKNNNYTHINYNRAQQRWDYVSTKSVLKCETSNKIITFQNALEVQYFINGVLQDYGACGGLPALVVALIEPQTLAPFQTEQFNTHFGNYNDLGCRSSREDKYFIFQTGSTNQMDSLAHLFTKLPMGTYVLVYNFGQVAYTNLAAGVKQALTNLGSDSINALQDNQAWILFSQIGNTAIAHEKTSTQANERIILIDSLGGNWNSGISVSEKIGPANTWQSLQWQINAESTDTALLQLWGIDTLQQQKLLIDSIYPPTNVINNLNQIIDAKKYKQLFLKLYTHDTSVVPDPAQMVKWQLLFTPEPEAMVNPSLHYTISNAKPMQGDSVTVTMAIQNISTVAMDSMLVHAYIYNAANQKINLTPQRYKPLLANDTLHCIVRFSTAQLAGTNQLWIEANPNNDQPEQFHFNNYAQVTIDVSTDITNPLLDVTFDGIHILNGDIVSAKPQIQISLKDENPFLLLNDTNDFVVFIYETNKPFNKKRLYFEFAPGAISNPSLMQWQPATDSKNKFNISYAPQLSSGTFTLEITAQDRSANQSGSRYTINFEVDTNATITELINYPNPFSTSTRFVFSITGSELPQFFKIQIMTISGKVVREITKEELGPLHIGRNITTYAWDGKDQYGDRLANGVYLYRVQTQLGGASIQKRETEADGFFKKGWGKMYILR